MFFLELLKNQIAMVLFVYLVIAIGSFIVMDNVTLKEVITLLIASAGSLVTGQYMERKRATDQIEKIDDKAAEAAQTVKEAEEQKGFAP